MDTRFAAMRMTGNIYVSSRKAGEHLLNDIREYLKKPLKLAVNENKSAVSRSLGAEVLGHSSKSIKRVIHELTLILRGWVSYFRYTQVKGVLE